MPSLRTGLVIWRVGHSEVRLPSWFVSSVRPYACSPSAFSKASHDVLWGPCKMCPPVYYPKEPPFFIKHGITLAFWSTREKEPRQWCFLRHTLLAEVTKPSSHSEAMLNSLLNLYRFFRDFIHCRLVAFIPLPHLFPGPLPIPCSPKFVSSFSLKDPLTPTQ